MHFRVVPRGVLGVFGRVQMVCVRQVGVVRSRLVIAGFVMLRCFGVVVSSLRVMVGCLGVMLRCLL